MQRYGWVLVAVLVAGGCLSQRPQWALEQPLQDVIDHKLLASVGVGVVQPPSYDYHSELAPYVSEFLADLERFNSRFPGNALTLAPGQAKKLRRVVYVDTLSLPSKPGVMAACNRYFSRVPGFGAGVALDWMTIEVLRTEVSKYTSRDEGRYRDILMKEVLYHELIHCMFSKGHLPTGEQGLMSATFTQGNLRAVFQWDKLLEEAFLAIPALPPAGS